MWGEEEFGSKDGEHARALTREQLEAFLRIVHPDYGRRDVPLQAELVTELRRHRTRSAYSGDEQLVFPARNGQPMRQENVDRRVLNPRPDLDAELAQGGNRVATEGSGISRVEPESLLVETGNLQPEPESAEFA